MTAVDPIDYKRAHVLQRRVMSVDIPAELVAKKGTSQLGKRRCRRAEAALRESIANAFRASGRRAYRSEVAVHLAVAGMSDIAGAEANRTVKAIVDAMKGAVFADDRAVELLEVSSVPGPLSAQLSICSVGEYADTYDVLSGVSDGRDEESFSSFDYQPGPWSWDADGLAGDELDEAREALNDLRTGTLAPLDLSAIERHYARRVADLEKQSFTATPYQSTDRPGKPNLAARIWDSVGIRGGGNCLSIESPVGGEGSWTDAAEAAWRDYVGRWPGLTQCLHRDDFALDIAVGSPAEVGFDVDNLAARVLTGMRRAIPGMVPLDSYRVYRRFADAGTVVVTFHHPARARELRRAMTGSPLAVMDLRPERGARVHRRQVSDEVAAEDFDRFLGNGIDAADGAL